ncbi:flagellar biosynthetic protein FliR [Burkholderia sp. WAC0059]|uniref:flagellar biosynthetic protein FliR n=1 Tax=Burkholderia sp. WAC0059 TaxID=2066022 RepID=UPI000C7F60B6|nr:flagellar biosynthetic protein FliR [Burkholderia sp. WAC0059]PLZ00669.1 flagellar biosynthetic protein FliR [Burkholderia sp. WAC0059]
MFSVTYAQLNMWLTAFLWPFTRILAFIAAAPVTGSTSFPTMAKIGLAAFMTLIVAPTIGPLPPATVFSAQGIWILANQFLVGVALGFSMQVVFGAITGAGELMGLGMGIGFATFFDPQSDATTPALSTFLSTIATLAFLSLDGHLQIISALVASFQSVPVTANLLAAPGWQMLANWGAAVLLYGLLISLPVVISVLIANLALGILNRAAPQIGIFQVGFALTLLVGMLLIQMMIPNLIPLFAQIFNTSVDEMGRIAAALR